MQLIIETDARHHERSGDLILLPACDTARRRYTVAVPVPTWDALRARHGDTATEHVERLAANGTWDTHNGRKVRRVGPS